MHPPIVQHLPDIEKWMKLSPSQNQCALTSEEGELTVRTIGKPIVPKQKAETCP